MAGYEPDALPRWFLARGWSLNGFSHTAAQSVTTADVRRMTPRLLRLRRPVELLARRAARRRASH
jgi:hypothetical protein